MRRSWAQRTMAARSGRRHERNWSVRGTRDKPNHRSQCECQSLGSLGHVAPVQQHKSSTNRFCEIDDKNRLVESICASITPTRSWDSVNCIVHFGGISSNNETWTVQLVVYCPQTIRFKKKIVYSKIRSENFAKRVTKRELKPCIVQISRIKIYPALKRKHSFGNIPPVDARVGKSLISSYRCR